MYYMDHILSMYVLYGPYSDSKVSQRKENVIKKSMRKRKYIFSGALYLLRKMHV